MQLLKWIAISLALGLFDPVFAEDSDSTATPASITVGSACGNSSWR